MKKYLFGVICLVIVVSLCSCKSKYSISDNATLIEEGKKGQYGFSFNEQIYYELPQNSYVVQLSTEAKAGKITICKKVFNSNRELIDIIPNRTYLLKKGKTYLIYFYNASFYNDDLKQIEEMVVEVLLLDQGVNIKIEHYGTN